MTTSSPKNPKDYEEPACASTNSDVFFSKDPDEPGYTKYQVETQQNFAKKICARCIHITECAEWGIKNEIYGVWGGLTPKERQKLRRVHKLKVPDKFLA